MQERVWMVQIFQSGRIRNICSSNDNRSGRRLSRKRFEFVHHKSTLLHSYPLLSYYLPLHYFDEIVSIVSKHCGEWDAGTCLDSPNLQSGRIRYIFSSNDILPEGGILTKDSPSCTVNLLDCTRIRFWAITCFYISHIKRHHSFKTLWRVRCKNVFG